MADGRIRFVPKLTNVFQLDETSRLVHLAPLWWGHRIPRGIAPMFRYHRGRYRADACASAVRKHRAGPDVLDTWFAPACGRSRRSAGRPIPSIWHVLPTSLMITGFDILFFGWPA